MVAWAVPAVTGTYVWIWIFDPLNGIATVGAEALGLVEQGGHNWFTDRLSFYAIVALNVIHHGFPFVAVTVLAGLLTIPDEMVEAAKIDGANAWRRFWSITVPTIRPVFAVVTILSTIWDFKVFTQVFLMPGGDGGNRQVLNLGVWAYTESFAQGRYGMGSAIAVLLTLAVARHHGHLSAHPLPRRGVLVTRAWSRAGKAAAVALVLLFTLFPFYWMVTTGFGPRTAGGASRSLLPESWSFDNVRFVIEEGQFLVYLRNSLIVATATVLASGLLALLAAIAVGRFNFRLRTTVLVMILVAQMVPLEALVIPLFLQARNLQLLNTLLGLIVVYVAFSLAFAVWMLRGFVQAIPREIEEAAYLDGASWGRMFRSVLLPLVAPGLVATSVFSFITAWNEFIFALTFMSDDSKYTVAVGLRSFFGQYNTDWGAVMAFSTLITLPVIVFFLVVQRRLSSGLVAGAVRG